MRILMLTTLLTLIAAPAVAQPAPRVATTLPPAELAELDRIRTDVWVHWFRADTAALRAVLPPELIAISSDRGAWRSLEETLAGSAAFKAGGGTFESVTFDSTTVHRFGDVVVMFSHYAVTTSRAGHRSTDRGRATEVFVRHRGRWVHTSWHLDEVP